MFKRSIYHITIYCSNNSINIENCNINNNIENWFVIQILYPCQKGYVIDYYRHNGYLFRLNTNRKYIIVATSASPEESTDECKFMVRTIGPRLQMKHLEWNLEHLLPWNIFYLHEKCIFGQRTCIFSSFCVASKSPLGVGVTGIHRQQGVIVIIGSIHVWLIHYESYCWLCWRDLEFLCCVSTRSFWFEFLKNPNSVWRHRIK